MKNNLKRVLSFVLVMMLMISCVPTMAFAAEDSTAYAAQNITTGVGYDSLASAMEAAEAGQTVKALADCAEPVSYRDGVILDLNGHALTNVTVAADATVTAIDSATDDYKGSFGTLSGDIAGTVAATVKTAEPKSYVSVCENGSWSFHRYYASITAISLKPASAALGYKAEFYGDEAVKNAVVSYGYELWVNNNAPKALSKSDKLEKNVLTLRLQNILKEGDAALNAAGSTATINGKAFITLNLNGKEVTLYGAEQSTTLRSTIEAINANVASYSESALQAVRSLCTTYADWMAGWATENIFGVAEGEGDLNVEITVPVTAENNVVTEEAVLSYQNIVAIVPAGAQLAEGTTELKLTITDKASSDSDVSENEGETLRPLDVHIEGISEDNTAPIIICLGNVLPKGLNIGNYELYHVEDGKTVPMTLADSVSELDVHNEFCYDPATGAVTIAVVSFSEIAMTSTAAVWEGNSAAPVEKNGVYYIYNADQLRGFAEMVGGMNGYTATDFAGKTVVLQADINLNDTDSENGRVFYPVGYYNTEGTYEKSGIAITSGFYPFKGTFDGNGHTISNFYQNTWEMKGDNNYYAATAQNYCDGMGLFGKVYGGTVKNLTVKDFSSDGEYTTTGTIAAYADCGATFENISIFNCNPRVYNIGNGGIVGCVGWYATEAVDTKVTLKNITVDNTNKISALWGSWDVACGGLVGQYYPTSGQSSANYPANAGIHMENCHMSAQIDVYNDVCANYQYYAYRYAGMMIGSIRENVTIDGHVYPKMDGISAKGCTVHFGDWNDYYYCELVANTLASYTHDHQMSRLEQVASVNGTTITYLDGKVETVPASGRYNYVVVKKQDAAGKWIHGDGDDYAECYHFVDGAVWNHEDAGTETVDGVEGVLKEDKQHIYREFDQLVTGYGWGVTSKGIGEMDGVTILDREIADSKEKFTAKVASNTEFISGYTVYLGSLFELANTTIPLDEDNIQVFVSPVGDDSTVAGTYIANARNWKQSALTLTGFGAATITITDYHFCTPTVIDIIVREGAFTGDFEIGVGLEQTDDVVAFTKANSDQDASIGTISYADAGVAAPANGGAYALKVSHENQIWPIFRVNFGKTLKAGTTVTFDLYGDYDYDAPEGVNKYMKLELAASSKDYAEHANPEQIAWVLTERWITGTITINSATDHIDLMYNVADSNHGNVASWMLLDNFKVVVPNVQPLKEGLTFEQESDSQYFTGVGGNEAGRDASFEIVSFDGDNALKLTSASTQWPTLRIDFGKTMKAGTVITFDAYTNDTSGIRNTVSVFEYLSGGDATAEYYHGSWNTLRIVLATDCNYIDLMCNMDRWNEPGPANLEVYLDNFVVTEPIYETLSFEYAADAAYFTDLSGGVMMNLVSFEGKDVMKISHANNPWPNFRINFGKTLKAGTTITFKICGNYTYAAPAGVDKYMKLELVADSKSFATSADSNHVVWTLVDTWATATITLTADTSYVDFFYNVADGQHGNVESWMYLDTVRVLPPRD